MSFIRVPHLAPDSRAPGLLKKPASGPLAAAQAPASLSFVASYQPSALPLAMRLYHGLFQGNHGLRPKEATK